MRLPSLRAHRRGERFVETEHAGYIPDMVRYRCPADARHLPPCPAVSAVNAVGSEGFTRAAPALEAKSYASDKR
jgi:hypothetical protein